MSAQVFYQSAAIAICLITVSALFATAVQLIGLYYRERKAVRPIRPVQRLWNPAVEGFLKDLQQQG
jgi:uncharacterized membrane protein YfbV (UPF0208 family)